MAFEIVTLKAAGLTFRPVTITIEIGLAKASRTFDTKVKVPGLTQAQLLDALANRPPVTIHARASDGYSQDDGDGGDLLLTGFVEKRSPSLRSAESELPISGRSKTGDVVDSAADHDTGEFKNKKAKEVFTTLAGKQDVGVESDLDHPARPLFRLRPGETIFTAAERWARAEGFAIGDTPEGKLKLAKAGTKRHAGSLTEGLNVLDASAVHDDSKRFGTVKVRAQAPSGYSPDELQIEADATDSVGGKRLKVIVPPEQIRKADARQRAKWHRDRAAGEGTTCEVTVTGWRDEAGTVWTPGWQVFTEIPSLGIVQDMLIKKASLKQSDSESEGTQAMLSLVDPRAFGGKKGKGSKSGKALDLSANPGATMTSEFTLASGITTGRVKDVDDRGGNQTIQVEGYKGERFTDVLRAQPHGFSSRPPVDAVGHFLRLGSSDRLVALGFETQGRPKDLPVGVPALYNSDGTVWKLLPGKADLDHGGKNHHARALGKYKVEATDWIQFDGAAVYLGNPPYYPVMTSAGPSQHVFAGIGPAAPDTPQRFGLKGQPMAYDIAITKASAATPALFWSTFWDTAEGLGDWRLAAANDPVNPGGLDASQQIASAVIISLFTDKRAPEGWRPEISDRRGWWGDHVAPEGEEPEEIGSHLWLLKNEVATEAIAQMAQVYATEALAWMIRDQVAASVTVTAGLIENPRRGVWLDIQIAGRDGALAYSQRFDRLWRESQQ